MNEEDLEENDSVVGSYDIWMVCGESLFIRTLDRLVVNSM